MERGIGELAGAWRNVDAMGESYEVRGLKVIRTDARGIREFTLHWDARVRRWRWGPRGRLLLVWIAEDAIAWVPEQALGAVDTRAWRWERCGRVVAPPPRFSSPGVVAANHQWRRSSRPDERPRSPQGPRRLRGRSWSQDRSRRHHSRERSHRRRHTSGERRRAAGHGGQSYDRHHHGGWRLNEASAVLPCGLSQREVGDLFFREITPEDYELLCRLDSAVEKPPEAIEGAKKAASDIENLPRVAEEDFIGESCTVCLSPFEAGDEVPLIACAHRFHLGCLQRWLAERPGQPTCPLCCKEVLPTSGEP